MNTPKTLIEWADALDETLPDDSPLDHHPDSDTLRAAADAWRQDLENLAIVDAEHAKLTAEVGALRKRVFDYGELITEHQGVIATLRKRLAEAERRDYAAIKCVPTNWLDPLLTGPEAVVKDCPPKQVEALLWAVRARLIAALAPKDET